ncbi:MAG TPA: glycosyltransferase family 39 protein [Ktedonobacterales bacterium]
MNQVRGRTSVEGVIGGEAPPPRLDSQREAWLRFKAWTSSPSGRIWVDAAQIWLFTRVVFLLLTYLVPALLTRGSRILPVSDALHRWVTLDAGFYVSIAQNGYDAAWRSNFWPLFPLLGHVLAPIFGGNYDLSLLAVSNLAFFGALVALRYIAERELGPEAAYRSALYLAVFPTAFFTFAPYTESLFLCLAITSFALIRNHNWWLAGLLGGLSVATRSSGVLLLAPFTVEFYLTWRAGKARWYQALASLLIVAGVGAYSLYLTMRFHDPLAFSHAKNADWRQTLTLPWQIPGQILRGISQLGTSSQLRALHFALNLTITLAFIALVVVMWRKLPFTYTAYSLAFFLYVLLFTGGDPTLAVGGNGRYMLMLFPAFMVLGAWGARKWLNSALLIGMLPLLAILCAHYLLHLAVS